MNIQSNTQPSYRKAVRRLAAAGLATLAALSVAVPAQASLSTGLKNGGCLSGIMVGHISHPDGSYTPICQTLD
ncbi:MAG: hypothetical protein QOH12_1410 [Solirubrobacteraceae bacterium]|jgi:hypothetical protein|nr:hypothetical protein [Solirubrobacteraceae bacterium]